MSCFLTGLGLGGIVGLLFAPKSGTATREDLLTAADSAMANGLETLDAQRQRLAGAVDAGVSAYRAAMGDRD